MAEHGYRVTIRQGWDGEEHVIHSERTDKFRLLMCQVTKGVSVYDSLEIQITPDQPQYANFHQFTTFVKVTRPDLQKTIFEGRVITPNDEMGTDGSIFNDVVCEGLEGFLHDSVQPFAEFHNTTPKDFLQAMITNHNNQVDGYKQLKLGNVTVTNSTDNVYRFLEDDKDTYDNITDKLINSLGGEIRVRHESDGLYLDYEPQIGGKSAQKIELGKNLLSLQRAINASTFYTALKPLGATQEPETTDDSTDTTDVSYPRLTIGGDGLIRNEALIAKFGLIVKANDWDDVTTQADLRTKGQAMMDAQKNLKTQIQLTYVDLSYIKKDLDSFNNGDTVEIVSQIQGIDLIERITGMVIDCVNIASSTMTIGEDDMNQSSYEAMNLAQANAANKTLANTTTILSEAYKTMQATIAGLQQQVKGLQNNSGNWTSGSMFVDLSSNNGTTSTTDQAASWYTSLYSKGVKGAMIKLTQGSDSGTDYTNPIFDSQKANVISAGMKYIGSFHYFTATSVSNATAEATHFLEELQSRSIDKSTIVACDVEASGLSTDEATLTSELAAFFKVLADAGYSKTCIYASESWFTSGRFTFADTGAVYRWVAAWGSTKPTTCDAWQSADTFNGLSLDTDYSYNEAFV